MKKRLISGFAAAAVLTGTAVPAVNGLAITHTANHTVKASSIQTTFLNKAAKQAQIAAKKYGTYPSVMIAQAIVESGWGQSTLATAANNLFGMKADDTWDGASYTVKTREEDNKGKSYYINAAFRKYPSFEASFEDNGKKLRLGVSWQPNRYQGAWIENASTSAAATKALTGTYATDHKYNQTLDKQIATYNLSKYDPIISKTQKSYTIGKNSSTYNWSTDHSVAQKSGSVKKGQKVTVDKTITYYNGTKRMHIAGHGWVNEDVFAAHNSASSQAPSTNTKVVKKMLMHNAYVYNSKGVRNKKFKALKEDKVITTYGTKTIKGRKFYAIGKNDYIAAGNVDGTMRILSHNAYVYNGSGNRDNNLKYKKGHSVATYGGTVKIMGKQYYKIGIQQYIKVGNFAK